MASGNTANGMSNYTATCQPQTMGPEKILMFRLSTVKTISATTAGSQFDTVLYVKKDDCMNGREIACNDDSGSGTTSAVRLPNAQPGTYFFFVDGFNGDSGPYMLRVTTTLPDGGAGP
jgi:hypothetical protein